MADFHQNSMIATLHDLYEVGDRERYLADLERKLEGYSRRRKIALLLPCLFSEIDDPSVLDGIVEQIGATRYIDCVAVALGGAPEPRQFLRARSYFRRLKAPGRDVKVIWIDGPRIQRILAEIATEFPVGRPGKGQSVWATLGYLFARDDCRLVALHDCDILTYDRIFLGRLIEPVANPHNGFEFCKGYYARISTARPSMHGRVTRLFVLPFLHAVAEVLPHGSFPDLERLLRFHRCFKYPLAGEFSFSTILAKAIDIAPDWALEVGVLTQVFHRVAPEKIVQIDLARRYDHRHRPLSPGDPSHGLHRMVVDIGTFYLHCMIDHGVGLGEAVIRDLQHAYGEQARRFIRKYDIDARVNGLSYDLQEELRTAEYFQDFLWTAWLRLKKDGRGQMIPSWDRVLSRIPGICIELLDAVEADNGEGPMHPPRSTG